MSTHAQDQHENALRQILAEEIKERGGPQEYIAMLGNRWMEIDSELPPELSAALAAMKRAALRARSTQKEATEARPERVFDALHAPLRQHSEAIREQLRAGGLDIVEVQR
jgi:hypothetical protein